MAVQFTAQDYFLPMLLALVGPLVGFLLLAIPLSRFLVRRTKRAGAALLPLCLLIPLMAVQFTYILPAGERTGCLYPEENAYTHTTAGTITSLRPADHILLYYYDGAFRGGVYVTIDGVEYYSMDHPALTEGTSLRFTYCPKDDLLMAFSPIDASEVSALQTPFVMPEPAPEEPVPELQVWLGTLLVWAGFGGTALLVCFRERLTLSYTVYLLEQDSRQRGEVVPNPAAVSAAAVSALPVCVAALGGAIAGNAWSLLFPLLIGLALMLLYPRFFSCHVRLEGRNIRIRRFGQERTYPLSSLRTVYWRQPKWDRFNRSVSWLKLVLVFDGWTLELDQESHLGLYDLHRRLSSLLP